MKKLICLAAVAAAGCALADGVAKTQAPDGKAEQIVEMEGRDDQPLFWGFGNHGMCSGYQLYGVPLNSEPTLQGYVDGNFNLFWDDLDFGYFGVGCRSTSERKTAWHS